MNEISLSNGRVAIVDDEDFERVNRINWSPHSEGYAIGYDPDLYVSGQPASKALVLLHRYVLGLKPGDRRRTDHRNHNKLDCRRQNLRLGTQVDNMMNRAQTIREGFSSRYRGVNRRGDKNGNLTNDRGYRYLPSKPFAAAYRGKYLGISETEEDAAELYDLAALRDQGPEAQLNFPVSGLEVCD